MQPDIRYPEYEYDLVYPTTLSHHVVSDANVKLVASFVLDELANTVNVSRESFTDAVQDFGVVRSKLYFCYRLYMASEAFARMDRACATLTDHMALINLHACSLILKNAQAKYAETMRYCQLAGNTQAAAVQIVPSYPKVHMHGIDATAAYHNGPSRGKVSGTGFRMHSSTAGKQAEKQWA